jgi:hypothetical protein
VADSRSVNPHNWHCTWPLVSLISFPPKPHFYLFVFSLKFLHWISHQYFKRKLRFFFLTEGRT